MRQTRKPPLSALEDSQGEADVQGDQQSTAGNADIEDTGVTLRCHSPLWFPGKDA